MSRICTICRHFQCLAAEDGDPCAFCEDQVPCPVQRSASANIDFKQTLEKKVKQAYPVKPSPGQSDPQSEPAKQCSLGCGRKIHPKHSKSTVCDNCRKPPNFPPDVVDFSKPANGNGHLDFELKPMEQQQFDTSYGRRHLRDERSLQLMEKLRKLPIGSVAELTIPPGRSPGGLRDLVYRTFKNNKEWGIKLIAHPKDKNVLGVVKERRTNP